MSINNIIRLLISIGIIIGLLSGFIIGTQLEKNKIINEIQKTKLEDNKTQSDILLNPYSYIRINNDIYQITKINIDNNFWNNSWSK